MGIHDTRTALDYTRFRVLAEGLDGPEGVVWDDQRSLLFAGGKHGDLYSVTLDGVVTQLTHFGPGAFVLGLALDAEGRIYVCERGNGRLIRFDPDSGEQDDYTFGTPARPLITPNYPAFASDGTLYLSDSGSWGQDDGVIFRIAPNGQTVVWSEKPSDFTNGLAVSPAEDALYVVESRGSAVWCIPIREDGSAGSSERVWHQPQTVPDGLAFDASGQLLVSLYRPDSIQLIDLASGEASTLVHDWTGQFLQAPTNLAFAGPRRSLLVTANLAGEHLAVYSDPVSPAGHPIVRPVIRP